MSERGQSSQHLYGPLSLCLTSIFSAFTRVYDRRALEYHKVYYLLLQIWSHLQIEKVPSSSSSFSSEALTSLKSDQYHHARHQRFSFSSSSSFAHCPPYLVFVTAHRLLSDLALAPPDLQLLWSSEQKKDKKCMCLAAAMLYCWKSAALEKLLAVA